MPLLGSPDAMAHRTRASVLDAGTGAGWPLSADIAFWWTLLQPFTWSVTAPDPAVLDAEGWPTTMVVRNGVLLHWVAILPVTDQVQGLHRVTWEGQGTLEVSHDVVDRRTDRLTLVVDRAAGAPPMADAVVLIITDTDPHRTGDHLRDIRFRPEGDSPPPCADGHQLPERPRT